MKKGITKALAMFCATAMIVSVFSVSVFAGDEPEQAAPEQAQEQEEEPQVAPANQNEEPAQQEPEQQGETSAVPDGYVALNQAYINSHDYKMPIEAGNYFLTESISVSSSAQIETNNVHVNIDLNGKTITYSGNGSMYILGKTTSNTSYNTGIELTINDTAGGGLITVAEGYTGGGSTDYYISGKFGHDDKRGGCILAEAYSTVTLNEGTIDGFKAGDEGGAICASNGAYVYINGGKITNCTAKHGGAISVNSPGSADVPTGKCVVSGGEITGNSATQLGGGIRCNRADLIITGGKIYDNNCGTGGGGIQVLKNKRVNQVLQISGNPQIYGNTRNNTMDDNLYLDSANGAITFSLADDLTSGANIHFGSSNDDSKINTNGKSFSLEYFACDDTGKAPYVSGSDIKMGVKPDIEGYNLVVGGAIKVKVSLSLGAFNNSDTAVTYAYSYDKNGTVKNMGREVAFSELVKNGNYYTFEIPVESACMTAPITVTVNYSGDKTVSDSATVEDCVNYILNHETDTTYTQKVKDVARALIRFGTFAQMQFVINTDKYPNIQEINASLEDTTYTLQGATYAPTSDPDSAYYAASISLLSQTDVKLYFYKDRLGDAYDMTVNYGGTSETISATSSGNFYVYVIKGPTGNGFNATAFDQSFSYTVGNVSGNYAVYDYLKLVEYKYHDDSTSIQRKVVEAYYDFARKCQDL